VTSKEQCCNECANRETCRAWDWNGRWCWVKDSSGARKASVGRWSGRLGAAWQGPNQSTTSHPPPSRSARGYDDSAWSVVDAPHDFGRTRMLHCQATGRRRRRRLEAVTAFPTFANNCSGWYRKHFSLPAAWRTGVTFVYFEGVHHYSEMWLNGRRLGSHSNGYTSFWHRLDTNGAMFGEGEANQNVLAVFADSAPGSGMYGYHGGGLTRHQYLVHMASASAFIPPEAAWVHTTFGPNSSIVAASDTPADGLNASGVDIVVAGSVTQATVSGSQPTAAVWIVAEITAGTGELSSVVGQGAAGPLSIPANGSADFEIRVVPPAPLGLWTVARPLLHTAHITVRIGGRDATTVDADNVTFGARELRFDPNQGLFLNRQHVKLRGFCDFGPFGAVGAATPDRVHLYRAQLIRSVGGNAWRMAHNPPAPGRLDVMDRLGMLALDENHYYGNHGRPYGTYNPEDLNQTVVDMADLVRRDRSHPSVFAWNLCNEVMCKDDAATAAAMRRAATAHDHTRPITMNHIVSQQGALPYLDVQGMSHRAGSTMDRFHAANPTKPILSTEAAICKTERGVDFDFCPRPRTQTHNSSDWCIYNNEQAACISQAVNFSDSRAFNAGTFLWAGFDHGSGSSGASGLLADWAGIKKPLAAWFRSWWLSNTSLADAGRPVLWPDAVASSGTTVFIVDSWIRPPPGSSDRTIHVYSNAPLIRLWLNGRAVAESFVPFFGAAKFHVKFSPGNLTAEALDGSRSRVATHTTHTGRGSAVRVRLSLDAPAWHTGTGSALVADGQDVALVRAELLDSTGRLVSPRDPSTNTSITFSVVAGGGRILGTISGSPFNQPIDAPQLNQTGPTFPAHYGLVRAYVQSTRVCSGSQAQLARLKAIHVDAGVDGTAQIGGAGCHGADIADGIVVLAKAEGMPAAQIRIPVTNDVGSLPMAVAANFSARALRIASKAVDYL
jgi:beta-galactosidase